MYVLPVKKRFRPLTRISLLVTVCKIRVKMALTVGFRPLTRISLLVTLKSLIILGLTHLSFRPLTRISLLVTLEDLHPSQVVDLSFRPLTRISLLVTGDSTATPVPTSVVFQTVDTDFSPGDWSLSGNGRYIAYSFRPLTRISLLVTQQRRQRQRHQCWGFRPLTRISLLVTRVPTGTPSVPFSLFQTVDTDFSPGDIETYKPYTAEALIVSDR